MVPVGVVLIYLILGYVPINAEICGETVNKTEKIVGGQLTAGYKYPWFVNLQHQEYFSVYTCGGSLISRSVVLTAAHCYRPWFNKSEPLESLYKARLGIYNSCKSENRVRTYATKKVVIHFNYPENRPFSDIALLLLDGDTSAFTPVCLPQPGMIVDISRNATVIGVGTTGGDELSCIVKEAYIKMFSEKDCLAMFARAGHNLDYVPGAFCAGDLEGGLDTCQGDSGGPLSLGDDNNIHTLLGITSFGFGCAEKGLLGVYTNVSTYVDWISLHIEKFRNEGSTTTTGRPKRKRRRPWWWWFRPWTLLRLSK